MAPFFFLALFATALAQCKYDTATVNCFCSDEVDITEKVVFVQIQSESCECVINLKLAELDDPPIITHSFDSSCEWTCTNRICVPDNNINAKLEIDNNDDDNRNPAETTVIIKTTVPAKTVMRTKKTEIKTTIPGPTNSNQGFNTSTMQRTITGFWIWCAVLTVFTAIGLLKLFHQLRSQQQQYQYVHSPSETNQISQTQTSFLSMPTSNEISTMISPPTPHHTSTPEGSLSRFLPFNTTDTSSETTPERTIFSISTTRPPLTPPNSSTPEGSFNRLPFLPFTTTDIDNSEMIPERNIFDTRRDSSPEPSAPPMELIEIDLETPTIPSPPVASRTRTKSKKKKTAVQAM